MKQNRVALGIEHTLRDGVVIHQGFWRPLGQLVTWEVEANPCRSQRFSRILQKCLKPFPARNLPHLFIIHYAFIANDRSPIAPHLRPSLFPELVTKDSGPMSFPFLLGILPKRFVRRSEDLEDEHAVGKSCAKLDLQRYVQTEASWETTVDFNLMLHVASSTDCVEHIQYIVYLCIYGPLPMVSWQSQWWWMFWIECV